MSDLRILVHFPTRSRRDQATKTLADYIRLADRPELVWAHAACNDAADVPATAMTSTVHPFPNKIAAYNAIPKDVEWDICLFASDDMWCIQQGWDTIVRDSMAANFPDLDGCLWFSDGRQDRYGLRKPGATPICTFSIMGRAAFERDGYVYHPSYRSFFCDNEWTEVWDARGLLYADPRCLFRNEHFAWGGVMKDDPTYQLGAGHKNENWKHDQQNYHVRKLQGWPKA